MEAVLDTPEAQVANIPQSVLELVLNRAESDAWKKLNSLDCAMAEMPQVEFKLNHIFTPGLYTREIFMPAGALLTSRIHLFEHPFVISLGRVSVWSDEHGWETFGAPFTGITKPGTRRLLYIHEDTIWSTFHVTNKTDPDEIVKDVTYPHLKLGHLAEIPADRKLELKP